jgi:hypothetical protein
MTAAFLNALIEWTAQHLRDPQARVVIPTGVVNAEELGRVLRALQNRHRLAQERNNTATMKSHKNRPSPRRLAT